MYRNAFISLIRSCYLSVAVFTYSHSLCSNVSVDLSVLSQQPHIYQTDIHTLTEIRHFNVVMRNLSVLYIAVAIAVVVIALVGRPSQHRTYGTFFFSLHINIEMWMRCHQRHTFFVEREASRRASRK